MEKTDPLSDLLGFTKAKSVAAGGFTAGGAWAFRVPAHGQLAFAAIAKGTCWVRLDDQANATKMAEGDVGLLCARAGFVVGSTPTATGNDVELDDEGGDIVALNGKTGCLVLFGRLALQPSSADVLKDVLPSTVYVPAASASGDDVRALVEMLRRERSSTRPGASAVARMLAELIFVQLLRAHLETSTALPPGWLRAAADERLLRALRVMHRDPGHPWTIAELARAAAMSRTRFAVHFRSVAGVAPLAYLSEWRMNLAKRHLREENVSVADLADRLGYATESGFSNAFKRIVGVAPSRYRATAKRESSTAK